MTLIPQADNSYDPVAEEYANQFFDELQHKPFDRRLLDRLVAGTLGLGPVCDLGCGPGHIARYLKDHGAEALGVDISQKMVEAARRLNPDIPFHAADMRKLPVKDGSWGGIAAFYSIIHVPKPQAVGVLREMHRVLIPGGFLLVAFHIGDEVIHLDEWWDKSVSLDFYFYGLEEMQTYVREAGFSPEESLEREPYIDVEHPSQRGYILAKKQPSVSNK
ncbi:MAG: class I SAM-dependent methyltransferase [Anaerolineales bacterium]|nr:class I SAM-dependent methyltransferase [Anaerolineales bacterium]